jgi:Na+/H+ antiporter NhaD/arsenite permease-like protein
MLANGVVELTQGRAKETSLAILWLSGVFSAFIDNVPFVAAMIPVIEHIGEVARQITDINPLWWSLALGTCLGGNGTLIGASANIVAVGIAKHNGYHIRFRDFTKISAVFTLLSLVICTFYILLRYF